MKARSAVAGGTIAATAAVLGNALVGKESLAWFRALKAPRGQLPMPGFVAVAALYYLIMGMVLARGIDQRRASTIAWAIAVLIGNEAWNGLLFGRRNPGAAFAGLLAFLLPLGGLQWSVRRDRRSSVVLLPYTAYVLGYDLGWSYRLWRLNPGSGR